MIHENLITLKEAGERLHGKPSERTIRRWVASGVGGAVLETVKVGGRRYTSTEAVGRFVEACGRPRGERSPRAKRKAGNSPKRCPKVDWGAILV